MRRTMYRVLLSPEGILTQYDVNHQLIYLINALGTRPSKLYPFRVMIIVNLIDAIL